MIHRRMRHWVIRRLLDAMDGLHLLPHRYRVVGSKRKPRNEMRLMPVRPHVVYYRIIESDKVVLISTVQHGAHHRPGDV